MLVDLVELRGVRAWLDDICQASDCKSGRPSHLIDSYLMDAARDQRLLNAAIRCAAIDDDPQRWYRSVEEYRQRYVLEAVRRQYEE